MSYVHLSDRPQRLTGEWVERAYGALTARIAGAEDAREPAGWLELFSDWNELKSYVDSEESRANYRLSKDLTDSDADEAARVVREELMPRAQRGDAELVAALLASSHAGAIAERYGEQLLRVLRVREATLATVNSELRIREGELGHRYDKLRASGEVLIGGEPTSLTFANSLTRSDDAATRREAFEAYHGWYVEQRDELASIFDELVRVRDRMGRQLGHANYVPLGYAVMERVDYGPEETARFRAAVREFVSPVIEQMSREQALAHGTPTLAPWDLGFHPGISLPSNAAAPVAAQLDKLGRALARLSPRLAGHFECMRERGLIDLEARKGKAGGAYCIEFHDEPSAAILCNSTGEEDDVYVLTHELGHAFQAWESQWIEAVDLRSPSSDACEIHSMGMEFLALPYLDEFFTPEQCQSFARNRWRLAVRIIAWTTLIDDFQHWVYETPTASFEQRETEFMRLFELYLPGTDWSGAAQQYKASSWYRILHLYNHPFYSIDYAIAELGAMQFGLLDAEDHDACLETYIELCRLGGTMSLTGLLQASGLRSPFDASLIEELMEHARSQAFPRGR